MTLNIPVAPLRRTLSVWTAAVLAVVISAVVVAVTPTQASALATFVDLGRADSFAVLAGSATTNTGPSVITGDVGVSPGTSITRIRAARRGERGPALCGHCALRSPDRPDHGVQRRRRAAPPTGQLPPDAGGLTLVPGVYTASSTLGLTGTLTLDAQGNPNAVWVFQIGSGLTTASGSHVSLINGASPCNVFWQIGSSATLGTSTAFVGNILAMTSITVTTGATIEGRALARNGAVTLDTNTITRPQCAAGTPVRRRPATDRCHHVRDYRCDDGRHDRCDDGRHHRCDTAGTTGATTAGTTGATTAGTTGARAGRLVTDGRHHWTRPDDGATTAGTTGAHARPGRPVRRRPRLARPVGTTDHVRNYRCHHGRNDRCHHGRKPTRCKPTTARRQPGRERLRLQTRPQRLRRRARQGRGSYGCDPA